MKTLSQFMTEAYDKDVMGRSQIRKTDADGRVGRDRKKSAPEMRRMKAVGGGKMEPIAPYKKRKDIGSQRQASTREQQPTKERGSAALSAKEAQRKAYLERKAREKGGSSAGSSKDKEKAASKLLTKKAPAKKVERTPHKASGYNRTERQKIQRTGERLRQDMIKGKEKSASHYSLNK
jgi:hypothetical protein